MKRSLLIFLLLATCARAQWSDLKAGLEPKAVMRFVGEPLMESKVRGGLFVTWIYDEGGYILFENGVLRYWQAPRAKKMSQRAVDRSA